MRHTLIAPRKGIFLKRQPPTSSATHGVLCFCCSFFLSGFWFLIFMDLVAWKGGSGPRLPFPFTLFASRSSVLLLKACYARLGCGLQVRQASIVFHQQNILCTLTDHMDPLRRGSWVQIEHRYPRYLMIFLTCVLLIEWKTMMNAVDKPSQAWHV